MNKLYITLAVVIGLVVGFVLGFTNDGREQLSGAVSGSTYSTQKSYQIIFAPATVAASTTGLTNNDTTDRIIQSVNYYCDAIDSSKGSDGAGVASFSWLVATSSVATNITGNTNFVLNTTVSTSSPKLYVASTTPGNTGSTFTRVWAAGTSLVWNATATSSAVCNVGVNVLSY